MDAARSADQRRRLLEVEIPRDLLKTRLAHQMSRFPVLLCPVAPCPRSGTASASGRSRAGPSITSTPGATRRGSTCCRIPPSRCQCACRPRACQSACRSSTRPWEELLALDAAQGHRTVTWGMDCSAGALRLEHVGGAKAPPPQVAAGADRLTPHSALRRSRALSLVTIGGHGLYTVHEIRALRDEQTAISERNRQDSLQLLRIQNNLATAGDGAAGHGGSGRALSAGVVAADLRSIAHRPVTGDRPRTDPGAGRAPTGAAATAAGGRRPLLAALDQMFRVAAVNEKARYRASADLGQRAAPGAGRHGVPVPGPQQSRAGGSRQQNREIYDRVVWEIGILVAALLVVVALTLLYIIRANRRAFDEVERLSTQLRNLSWRMLKLQEDLQQSFSRELHDEFGQMFTAMGTLLGRVKRNLPARVPARRRPRRGPSHRPADPGEDPRAIAFAASRGARRLRAREGARVVRRAVRPAA